MIRDRVGDGILHLEWTASEKDLVMEPESQASTNRRQFVQSVVPAGCFACVLQSPLLGALRPREGTEAVPLPEPDSDSHWTYRRIYRFAYRQWMIPHLENLAESVGGRHELVEMLKKSSLALGRQSGEAAGASTFEEFVDFMAGAFETSEIYQNTLTWEPLKVTEEGLEIRITSCLWAQTFRDADAADFGYAVTCYQDVGMAEAFGSFLRMERPSSLMEGGEACVFRFLKT